MKDTAKNLYIRPAWLKKKINWLQLGQMKRRLRLYRLHSVCEEARCPNISECFGRGEVTFLLLGDVCTRRCRFCQVKKQIPKVVDEEEPQRVADFCSRFGIKYAVLTSVTRDDLKDGGAEIFLRTVSLIKQKVPVARVELLIPDFCGQNSILEKIAFSPAEVVGHNIETVPSLYKALRPQALYRRSLDVLAYLKKKNPALYTKSGLMLGLGEREEEVISVMEDLRQAGCDILTLGQYLPPSAAHFPVQEYVLPSVFSQLKERALKMGFKYVMSSPYVRSSYRASLFFK